MAALAACGDEPNGPTSARIDFVDGAVEPVVTPGRLVVLEGLGFGATPGTVGFARQGGGEVEAPVAPEAWHPLLITVRVPAAAVSGEVNLHTAAGAHASALVHVVPAVSFDPGSLAWQPRAAFAGPPAGVALAAAEFPGAGGLSVTLYAAGGAVPSLGGAVLTPDSGIYVARPGTGTAPGNWTRQLDSSDPSLHRNLPAPRAYAAAAVATRYNSRFPGAALYVIGGVDATGRPQSTVYAADASADEVVGRFVSVEPLPSPLAGAMAVMRRGRIYVVGGVDSTGAPMRHAFVGRIGIDGRIDGWYEQPLLPAPRAYGGSVVLDSTIVAFGGMADTAPLGGGLDATPPRLVTSDTARLSLASGFFLGPWVGGLDLLPTGRSQFATLVLGDALLAVGGMYAGADVDAAETLAAPLSESALGPFTGPVGNPTIHDQSGGTLIGPAGAAWRGPDGTPHGIVLGGIDLVTREGRGGVWGF